MKTHTIKTTKDILNAVNKDNVEGFLKDFEVWLRLTVIAKTTYGNGLVDSSFTWRDDGEYGKLNGVKTEIKFK